MTDKVRHGRQPRGEESRQAKITEEDVRKIRALASEGISVYVIARRFGVNPATTYSILMGKIWKHVPWDNGTAPMEFSIARGARLPQTKLAEDDIREIRRLNSEGVGNVDLGRQFHVSPSTICDIAKGRTWKYVT
jgi:hypothetical protein